MKDFIKEITSLIDPETRRGLLFLTGASILALTALFFAGFVSTLPWASPVLQQLGLPDWGYGLIFLLIVYMLFVVLASDDTLYYGNPARNRFARAFQKNLPSTHLSLVLGIDKVTATYLWFDEFNRWSDPKHERHEDWNRTFQRGYSCRFIYYLWRFGLRLLCLCAGWLMVEVILYKCYGHQILNPEAKVAVSLFVAFLLAALYWSNWPKPASPVGVWRRFDEINKRHCDWIDLHVGQFRAALADKCKNA